MTFLKRCICLVLLALAVSTSASSTSKKFVPRSLVNEPSTADGLGGVLSNKKRSATFLNGSTNALALVSRRGGDNGDDDNKKILGAAAFVLMDSGFRRLFVKYDINFPSQLGGCIILFLTMLMAELVSNGTGDDIFNALVPGSTLLAKWLPVFFVPGLAMLPLAPSVGGGLDIAKVLAVVILGFFYSLSTVGFSVLALRLGFSDSADNTAAATAATKSSNGAPAAKPYREETASLLLKAAVVTGAMSIAANKLDFEYKTPVETCFFFIATVASYVWAALLPSGFNKIVHPLITSTGLVWALMALYGYITGSSFEDVLKTYKVGSLDVGKTGAGDVLLHLLGPAVVSFAISMYSRKQLLKENLFIVTAAFLVSSAGGLFGTAAFVNLINLGGASGKLVRLSVLSRNVTTALAMAVTNILGGDISIAASVVVLTGIVCATYGRSLLNAMGIHDPVSRGLAIGAAGQGLGVASLIPEPDAFPFAAMSMVLTAVCATTLVSIPAIKECLIKVAGPKALAATETAL